jgi:hypothetical protein
MTQAFPQPTEAKLKRMTFKQRLIAGSICALFAVLICLFVLHRPAVAVFAAIVLELGFLFGVDEWTTTITGNCPHCGTAATLGANQNSHRCNSCRQSFSVDRQQGQYRFVPKV